MLLEHCEEVAAVDRQALRVFERDRRRGQAAVLIHGNGRERIAAAEDLQDDLLATRRGLEDLDAALDDGEERLGRLAFAEDDLALRKVLQPGDLKDVTAVVRADAAEHVDLAQ